MSVNLLVSPPASMVLVGSLHCPQWGETLALWKSADGWFAWRLSDRYFHGVRAHDLVHGTLDEFAAAAKFWLSSLIGVDRPNLTDLAGLLRLARSTVVETGRAGAR